MHAKFLLQHSSLVYEDMKFLQKHDILVLIFCIYLCDVRTRFIFDYFVISVTLVLGDDISFGNS